MRRFGKRLFTRLREGLRPEICTDEKGRFGDCRAAFFALWWGGVFAGVLVKCGGWLWCFCGEVVVGCVVNVVS
jgi:hypothetical protein